MLAGVGGILDGAGTVEERSLLDAELLRGGKSILRTLALNEAVLGKGSQGRLIEFSLSLDGEFVYTLRADGMIVATPTGSTAYAMSAQGPILHPAVPALALVPLNPHTLSARPVSVSDRSVIEIVLLRAMDARAHFDGFALADMAEGDRMVLKRSADTVRFVHPPGYRYFATLREKLRWSEALVKNPERE
jgi:NAD+ kinase